MSGSTARPASCHCYSFCHQKCRCLKLMYCNSVLSPTQDSSSLCLGRHCHTEYLYITESVAAITVLCCVFNRHINAPVLIATSHAEPPLDCSCNFGSCQIFTGPKQDWLPARAFEVSIAVLTASPSPHANHHMIYSCSDPVLSK